jgi:hypothetical protein
MKPVKTYYPKRFWYRKPKRWRPPRMAQTKGGEPFGDKDEKPAEQEGSQTVHQREGEAHHSGGIDLLFPSGTENQEHNPQGHKE